MAVVPKRKERTLNTNCISIYQQNHFFECWNVDKGASLNPNLYIATGDWQTHLQHDRKIREPRLFAFLYPTSYLLLDPK